VRLPLSVGMTLGRSEGSVKMWGPAGHNYIARVENGHIVPAIETLPTPATIGAEHSMSGASANAPGRSNLPNHPAHARHRSGQSRRGT
jgi:hypothetical protein